MPARTRRNRRSTIGMAGFERRFLLPKRRWQAFHIRVAAFADKAQRGRTRTSRHASGRIPLHHGHDAVPECQRGTRARVGSNPVAAYEGESSPLEDQAASEWDGGARTSPNR